MSDTLIYCVFNVYVSYCIIVLTMYHSVLYDIFVSDELVNNMNAKFCDDAQ